MPSTSRFVSRLAAAVATLVAVPLLGACSGGGNPAPTELSAAQRLAQVKAVVDKAPSVHLSLTSRDLAEDVSGLLGLEGVGAHPPAFQGTAKARVAGLVASFDIIAVDGRVHVKLPLTTIYRVVDPATLGAPDPAALLDPARGVTSLLTTTRDPARGAEARVGPEVVRAYAGVLPGSAITGLFGIGSAAAEYRATYGVVEDSSQLRTVEITGPFYGGAVSTYVLTLDRYGEPVTITAP
jgi:lipoprotein LprG